MSELVYILDQVFTYRRRNQQHVVLALGGSVPIDSFVVFQLLGFDAWIIYYELIVSVLSNYFTQIDSHHSVHVICLGIFVQFFSQLVES